MEKKIPTTTEEFREDAKFLRELATNAKQRGMDEGPERLFLGGEIERLERIANNVDMMAQVMFTPRIQLEKRIEEVTANKIEVALGYLENDTHKSTHQEVMIVLGLWRIEKALRDGASKSLVSSGLAGLGMGAAASLFGSLGRAAEKQNEGLSDPEDK